jgi:hypothetical protein
MLTHPNIILNITSYLSSIQIGLASLTEHCREQPSHAELRRAPRSLVKMRHLEPVGTTILLIQTSTISETSSLATVLALGRRRTVEVRNMLVADITEPIIITC